jgi:hypothetical protein
LLAGQVGCRVRGRYCFQTTYLNDRIDEYFEHDRFRLIWIIREPMAVVYSMLHNWKYGALRRLYDACGRPQLTGIPGDRNPLPQWLGPSRLTMACASYVGKAKQTFLLSERLGERMMIVDYDEMVLHKDQLLPRIFNFAGVEPTAVSFDRIHNRSVGKGKRFSRRAADRIAQACEPVYRETLRLRTIGVGNE